MEVFPGHLNPGELDLQHLQPRVPVSLPAFISCLWTFAWVALLAHTSFPPSLTCYLSFKPQASSTFGQLAPFHIFLAPNMLFL